MRKTIVLAADNQYLIPLETTIKSIMCHNTEVDLYILNSDIAPEWFKLLHPRLAQLDSTIHNVRLDDSLFRGYKTANHINVATYYRFLIPQLVLSNRVLYVDCDLIVNGDLTALFEVNMGNHPIGAVHDNYGFELHTHGFNAGVLLIDNQAWRENDITSDLLQLAVEKQAEVKMADQSLLNMYFENNWFHLDGTYNYLVGIDVFNLDDDKDKLEDKIPVIVHYASHDKPWNTFSVSRLRELWWSYRQLDWYSIIQRSINLDYKQLSHESQKSLFVYTYVVELEHISYLIEQLPDYHFHIAAPTFCAPSILNLSAYSNVTIYQNMFKKRAEWILDEASIYLDINHYLEVDNVIQKAKDRQVPIVAFENTCHDSSGGAYVYSHEHPEEMVAAIKQIMEEKKHA